MIYFVVPFLLLIYFEILGRYFFYKIKKEPLAFSFLIGFVLTMAFLYIISWPITAFNGNFYHLVALYLILFAASIVFILKDIKKICFKFDVKTWIIFFILVLVEIYISYNRALGDPHGFDTLYYINTVNFNIGNTELNSLHPHFGTFPNTDIQWITYVFQSYYYFIAVFIWLGQKMSTIVGISFEMMPAFVWIFQIFGSMFFIGTSITCIKEINNKNKFLNLAFICLLVLFLGNLYYNNVFAFIGNNYRMSIHALATIYLFRYFKDKSKYNLFMCFALMEGMCALSSTGTFALIFLLFALFYALCDEEKNLLKYYVVFCFVPTINILVTKLGQKWWIPFLVLLVFAIIWILNDQIIKLFKNKLVKIGSLLICFTVLAILSYTITGNIFDFNAFFNNYSEIADMSFDYFMFNDLRHWLFNMLILGTLLYFLIKNRNHKFSITCLVLMFVLYNPLTCTYLNHVNWVYYRTYDIIINNFTIVFFINYLIDSIDVKLIKNGTVVLVLIVSIILSSIQVPMYYHESFVPDDDYNYIYKMENSELELIRNIRDMINYLRIENPRIINQTFYMPSYIKGEYLFGKEKRYNYDKYDDISFNLYLIFFPHDYAYDNFWPDGATIDYENLKYYLDNCDYDILIVNSNSFYYDKDNNYIQISSYVENCGYSKSAYSTYLYDVYYLK